MAALPAPITWLVFWQAGLTRSGTPCRRLGRIVSSIVLVAAITLAFGWGTNYDFTTSGLIPTACVTSALAIGLLRAAYESSTLELQRLLRVRRRVLLVGEGPHPRGARADADLAAAAAGVRARRLVRPGRDGPLAARLDEVRPDEIVVSEGGFDEETVLDLVETAHRTGARADRAEDDRAPDPARRVRAGPGRACSSSCSRRCSRAPTGR